jgi:hypothetical protein
MLCLRGTEGHIKKNFIMKFFFKYDDDALRTIFS